MEEELNQRDLEERLYAMLHHVDQTEGNLAQDQNSNVLNMDIATKSTVRRYWHTIEPTEQYQKVNTPEKATQTSLNKEPNPTLTSIPKEEMHDSGKSPSKELYTFQSPVSENIKKTIEILENFESHQIILETSDEDEVTEIALSPKQTITIESSDDDELTIINPVSLFKHQSSMKNKFVSSKGHSQSSSPAPSVVSLVSDEFIHDDCKELNISSKCPGNQSFDFSLHRSYLLVPSTRSANKMKTKDVETSTPVIAPVNPEKTPNDKYFMTPKSKSTNTNQKTKWYSETKKSIPDPDIYDSDSNQSVDTKKNKKSYMVTENSLPSTDVYESDSNLSEDTKDTPMNAPDNLGSLANDNPKGELNTESTNLTKQYNMSLTNDRFETVDLTDDDGNNISKFESTKIPSILNEDLDFGNLKGKDKVCRRRKYSLTTLRAEMDKFYNESWGGENFNHTEIQKNMSRDKNLWLIDPKDRIPSLANRRLTCYHCNKPGHRSNNCGTKQPVCYMCGVTGHLEQDCPRKICLNCGSPNYMYSTTCRVCYGWAHMKCRECGQNGHLASHCPDLWRRYHNTIDNYTSLVRCIQTKKPEELYCSGCSKRGHLIHTCRVTIPYFENPINSPYVFIYRPVHPIIPSSQSDNENKHNNSQECQTSSANSTPRNDCNKRQSKSPTCHETHFNKKKNMSGSESPEQKNSVSPVSSPWRITCTSREEESTMELSGEKGNRIEDNDVSDTNDAVTTSRIYVSRDIIEKLITDEGRVFLKTMSEKYNVVVDIPVNNSFLSIRGKVEDQKAFHAELRNWVEPSCNTNKPNSQSDIHDDKSVQYMIVVPKNRNNLLRHLSKALESLKEDLGEPNSLYKELQYLMNRHEKLINQNVVNLKQLTNNRGYINKMLKKLNMVLLGQAGLADGEKHLTELYSYKEKLMNSTQKNISPELRKEINQHYICIFSAAPRDDYIELLNQYNESKQTVLLNKKKNRALWFKSKINIFSKEASVVPIQNSDYNAGKDDANSYSPHMMQKLAFYHKRVLSTRPNGSEPKKTRIDLVNKLHSLIGSMFRNENISSRALKKIKRTQKQAQMFLYKM